MTTHSRRYHVPQVVPDRSKTPLVDLENGAIAIRGRWPVWSAIIAITIGGLGTAAGTMITFVRYIDRTEAAARALTEKVEAHHRDNVAHIPLQSRLDGGAVVHASDLTNALHGIEQRMINVEAEVRRSRKDAWHCKPVPGGSICRQKTDD